MLTNLRGRSELSISSKKGDLGIWLRAWLMNSNPIFRGVAFSLKWASLRSSLLGDLVLSLCRCACLSLWWPSLSELEYDSPLTLSFPFLRTSYCKDCTCSLRSLISQSWLLAWDLLLWMVSVLSLLSGGDGVRVEPGSHLVLEHFSARIWTRTTSIHLKTTYKGILFRFMNSVTKHFSRTT